MSQHQMHRRTHRQTWLHHHLARMRLPMEPFYDNILAILTCTAMDPADKCEALLDMVEESGVLSPHDAEVLVRALLDTLESRGPESLLYTDTCHDDDDNSGHGDGNMDGVDNADLSDLDTCSSRRLRHDDVSFKQPASLAIKSLEKQRYPMHSPILSTTNTTNTTTTTTTTTNTTRVHPASSTASLFHINSRELNFAAPAFTPSFAMDRPSLAGSSMYMSSTPDAYYGASGPAYTTSGSTPADIDTEMTSMIARIDMQDDVSTIETNAPILQSTYSMDATNLMGQNHHYLPSFQTYDAHIIDSVDDSGADEAAEEAYWDMEESQGLNALSPHDVLQSIFVNIPFDHIQKVLEANMYNIESTMDYLLNNSERSESNSGASAFSNWPSLTAPSGPSSHALKTTPSLLQSTVVSSGSSPNPSSETKQVCRHFILGQCYRSDCWYSHDPDALVCKFWLQGRCFKGDECEFVHGDRLSDRISATTNVQHSGADLQLSSQSQTSSSPDLGYSTKHQPVANLSNRYIPTSEPSPLASIGLHLAAEEEFPSLVSVSKSNSNPASTSLSSTPATHIPHSKSSSHRSRATTKIDFWGTTAKYNDVTKKPAPDPLLHGRGAGELTAAASLALKGRRTIVIGGSGASFAKSAAAGTTWSSASSGGESWSNTRDSTAASYSPIGDRVHLNSKWVSTGDTLAASYVEYRHEAIEVALNRNKLFQRATEAFLAGNKAAARALSLSAKRLNDEVEQLHNIAAKKIFTARNASSALVQSGSSSMASKAQPGSGIGGGGGSTATRKQLQHAQQSALLLKQQQSHTIDLHGLHASEAILMLQSTIESLMKAKFVGELVIITGTGHHSRTHRAKVLPEVRSYLQQGGWRPAEGTLHDRRGGMLVIQIK
ncbi:hypothetical protein BASA83_010140 [Batrachochytrium salamandrivorans]|nr:hypothetical protein BASA83_010140 [Batrachochytrium salamandrivorans]